MRERDRLFMLAAINLACTARKNGNHPFGALIINPRGETILTAENTVITQQDVTAHAELNLIRVASKKYSADVLKTFTLYTSTEPCPMCAGAIVWSNIRNVVYGLGMEAFYKLIGNATRHTKLENAR